MARDTRSPSPVGSTFSSSKRSRRNEDYDRDRRDGVRGSRRSRSPEVRAESLVPVAERPMLTASRDRDGIAIVMETAGILAAVVIEMTSVAVIGQGTGATDIGEILRKTRPIGRAEEIVRAKETAHARGTVMVIVVKAATETIVAGEKTHAIDDDDEGMIQLTPDLPDETIAEAMPRARHLVRDPMRYVYFPTQCFAARY